ncbi:MAG: hypothetical protein WDM89_19965 [Rhizomicrobium sp.]
MDELMIVLESWEGRWTGLYRAAGVMHGPPQSLRDLESDHRLAPLGVPEFVGADPVVPTPFPVAEAAAASLGFSAAAAAEIWRLRGGERQDIAIDLKAAAASLVSFNLSSATARGSRGPRPTRPQ